MILKHGNVEGVSPSLIILGICELELLFIVHFLLS